MSYYPKSLIKKFPWLKVKNRENDISFLQDSVLFAYAQIFFSNKLWFGFAVLLATFITPQFGVLSLLGVIICNLLAVLLKFDREKIRTGFYGFNGILFGSATAFYFNLNDQLLYLVPIFIIITFFVSVILEHHLAAAFNLPGLSLPFILTVYIFVIFLSNYNNVETSSITSMKDNLEGVLPIEAEEYFKTFALIIFQPKIAVGIILAIAVLFFSRVMFILSIFAFTFNYFFFHLILPEHSHSLLILTGFNSILTAFALGGSIIIPSRKSLLLVFISVPIVIIMSGFFIKLIEPLNLPVLVLPFNFITLSVVYSLKFRKEHTDFVLLYFKPGSPEENYYYHHKQKTRFENFKYIFPELPFYGEWVVSQGINGNLTHMSEWQYAWDFVIKDDESDHANNGEAAEDYFCYNLPVLATMDGTVVKTISNIKDNTPGEVNINKNWGNTVVMSHGYDVFSSVSHLKCDAVKVKEGDKVKKGDLLGHCGNSGRSPLPHLHFQFQYSDRIGDKTLKFPIANYLVNESGKLYLKTFDYPAEGSLVSNIESNKIIVDAFKFRLGDKIKIKFNYDGKEQTEVWDVKVDIQNQMYIESGDARGDIYITEKVFYFLSYMGGKNTALYYFYLLSMRVPLCFDENVYWEDDYSIAQLPTGFARYIAEFLLLYKPLITAKGEFCFKSDDENKLSVIHSEIKIKGTSIFSFVNKILRGDVCVDEEGRLHSFRMTEGNKQINFTVENTGEEFQ